MTIKSDVYTALSAVLVNTWAVELPPAPSWPAIVFDVDTAPEEAWPDTYGYDLHTVAVVILARTLGEIPALQAAVDTALQGVQVYLRADARGDAEYEPDASVYAYFSNHIIRQRRS